MKGFIVIIAICLASLIAFQIVREKETLVNPPVSEITWIDYTAPSPPFKIALPETPQRASDNVKDTKLQVAKHLEIYAALHPNGTLYMVNTITYPEKILVDEIAKKGEEGVLMDSMNTMLAANPKNKLMEVAVVDFQNHKSIDFSMQNEEKTIFAKSFLAGNSLFVLAEVGGIRKKPEHDFEHFIESFQLIPQSLRSP